jgi:DNA-binding beta-propeller fold protein YncE
MVFTADQTKPQLAVINAASNQLKTWIALPAVGYGTTPTTDGKWLLVAMPSAGKVAVVDLGTLTVVRTIDVPAGPGEILARPDGQVAYVSCPPAHQVAVIDLSDWKVKTMIEAGAGADGLGWAGKSD